MSKLGSLMVSNKLPVEANKFSYKPIDELKQALKASTDRLFENIFNRESIIVKLRCPTRYN